jgi:hypothetical protein
LFKIKTARQGRAHNSMRIAENVSPRTKLLIPLKKKTHKATNPN